MKERYKRSEINGMDGDAIYQLVKNEMQIPRAAMMSTPELRSEAIFWLTKNGKLVEDAVQTDAPATGAVTAPPVAVAPSTARINYGGYDQEMPVVGKTIQQVFDSLRAAWNIDPNALIYLNSQLVTDRGIKVEAGSVVEFARPAGQKG